MIVCIVCLIKGFSVKASLDWREPSRSPKWYNYQNKTKNINGTFGFRPPKHFQI